MTFRIQTLQRRKIYVYFTYENVQHESETFVCQYISNVIKCLQCNISHFHWVCYLTSGAWHSTWPVNFALPFLASSYRPTRFLFFQDLQFLAVIHRQRRTHCIATANDSRLPNEVNAFWKHQNVGPFWDLSKNM